MKVTLLKLLINKGGCSMSYLKKPKYGNTQNASSKGKAWSKAFDLIGLHNPWINADDYRMAVEPLTMSDEEVYYIASVVSELKTLTQQRALIDMIHLKCDDYTVKSFMSYFSSDSLERIMFCC
tara:strand:- start:174 stop:542 length:369 start_codon:yes stop_codon:yes gene_type:complete